MSRKTRGVQRFAAITYSQLSKWTGLSIETIRSYGAKGVIPKDDLPATLRWVNERRVRKGLPLIGDPDGPIPDIDDPPTPANPTSETNDQQSTPDEDSPAPTGPPPSHAPSCRCHDCYLATKAKRA